MATGEMGLVEAVRTRRSAGRLYAPAPTDVQVERLVALAMNAPDHALLRPWRLVLLRGQTRQALGTALARACGDPQRADRLREKPFRAPLLIGIVFRPREHPKVPEWEQLAAAVGMVTTLCQRGRRRSHPPVDPAVHLSMLGGRE